MPYYIQLYLVFDLRTGFFKTQNSKVRKQQQRKETFLPRSIISYTVNRSYLPRIFSAAMNTRRILYS